jgi:hypothetical protein
MERWRSFYHKRIVPLERWISRIRLYAWLIGAIFALATLVLGFSQAPPYWAVPAALFAFALAVVAADRISVIYHRRQGTEGISLLFGVGAPFDQYRSRIHFREHLIRIGIENRSFSQQLTNCEVTVEQISGRLSPRCPVKVKSGFTLNPGAKDFIPFVQWDEVIRGPSLHESSTGKDQGIEAFFPINPLSDGISYLDDQPYEILLRATAAESPPDLVKCRLWIENGALKLQVI